MTNFKDHLRLVFVRIYLIVWLRKTIVMTTPGMLLVTCLMVIIVSAQAPRENRSGYVVCRSNH